MKSSIWFITVNHSIAVDKKDAFVDIEDGTGLIDRWEIESTRNTSGGECFLMLILHFAVAIDEAQFRALKKQLEVSVNGDKCVILRHTTQENI